MSIVIKQAFPNPLTLADLWTVPASRRQAESASIFACNQGDVLAKIRVSVAPAGAADNRAQYLWYDLVVPPHKTWTSTVSMLLATSDVVRVYSDTGQVSFNAFTEDSV